ncbi:MAG: type II toxin-antitoxin system VapB family antitoxin [Acidimicrobiales bacterium]
MTKRLIDVDDDLLDRARLTLGTETLKETVNSALAVVVGERHERVKAALDHFARLAREGALHDRSEAWG